MNNQSFKTDDQVPIFHLEFDKFCLISHCILIIFGIPLNLIVTVVILSNHRLKNKPRNILFLGIVISSLFSLVTVMLEIIAHYFESPLFCKITGLILGVPYTCILKNLLLALLDRYLAITRPLLHLKTVTVRNVRIIQIIGVIVIFFFIKWPVIFSGVPFRCDLLLIEAKTIAMHQSILILLCVVCYVLVYFKTKQYARPNRVISVSYANRRDEQVIINVTKYESDPCATASMLQVTSHAELQMHGGSHGIEVIIKPFIHSYVCKSKAVYFPNILKRFLAIFQLNKFVQN